MTPEWIGSCQILQLHGDFWTASQATEHQLFQNPIGCQCQARELIAMHTKEIAQRLSMLVKSGMTMQKGATRKNFMLLIVIWH